MNSDDWISVKDRLPEEGHFDDYIGELKDNVVTHLQPLPGGTV